MKRRAFHSDMKIICPLSVKVLLTTAQLFEVTHIGSPMLLADSSSAWKSSKRRHQSFDVQIKLSYIHVVGPTYVRIIISINYKCVVYARPYIEDLGGKCLLKHFDIVTNAKTTFYTRYMYLTRVYCEHTNNTKKPQI